MTMKTPRGFDVYAYLVDRSGSEVYVSESSLAFENCVRIQCSNADPMWKEGGVQPEPHLTIEQAKVVRAALDEFIGKHDKT